MSKTFSIFILTSPAYVGKICVQKGALQLKHACQKLRNFKTIGVFVCVNGFTSNYEDVFGKVLGRCA